MASFALPATTGGARKQAWTKKGSLCSYSLAMLYITQLQGSEGMFTRNVWPARQG